MPPPPIYLLQVATAIPSARLELSAIKTQERARYEAQLGALSPAIRTRLETQLGIDAVRRHDGPPSTLALAAANRALEAAQLRASAIGAILDYSTVAGDYPGIAATANWLQAELGAEQAVPYAVQGSGCAGLLVALRVARAWLGAHQGAVLLFGTDCLPDGGRSSLPVSIMGDAASAVVLSATPPTTSPRVAVRAVTTATLGRHHALVKAVGHPPRIEVDAAAFEQHVLPVHFVMCQRVLDRALSEANCDLKAITHVVYPNTTALDRSSVARALGFARSMLTGPGPRELGHCFANDLLINLPDLNRIAPPAKVAILGVGSGFTWGAAILDVEPAA